MGTPEFAVPSLRALAHAGYEIPLVVTRPDAVRSRGKKLEPSPVKAAALELGLTVIEANRITPDLIDTLSSVRADIFCVAAYGCILPDSVLHMARLGIVNVHASLLPRWRGAAPIQRSILAGDETTGVSIMKIGRGVDTGAYCAQASCPVAGKTAAQLTEELAELGAQLLVDTLPLIDRGDETWTEQDESLVTHAAKITKAEMRIDSADSADSIVRHVLASSDAAPARCIVCGKGVRVMDARVVDQNDAGVPSLSAGDVLVAGKRLFFGASNGCVEVLEVKPDGKRAMPARAWAAGLHDDAPRWEKLV